MTISDSCSDLAEALTSPRPSDPTVVFLPSPGSLKSSPSMSHMEALGKAWNRQLR